MQQEKLKQTILSLKLLLTNKGINNMEIFGARGGTGYADQAEYRKVLEDIAVASGLIMYRVEAEAAWDKAAAIIERGNADGYVSTEDADQAAVHIQHALIHSGKPTDRFEKAMEYREKTGLAGESKAAWDAAARRASDRDIEGEEEMSKRAHGLNPIPTRNFLHAVIDTAPKIRNQTGNPQARKDFEALINFHPGGNY